MAYDTSVLDAALARKAAAAEQERQALLGQLQAILDEVAVDFHVEEAYIFGSLARPNRFHVDSDVDVAVSGVPGDRFFTLAALLSSRLGRDVDLVPLEEVPIAESIRAKGLRWTKSS